MFYWDQPFSVGLVDQLFQPASNRVETVEKALVATTSNQCRVLQASKAVCMISVCVTLAENFFCENYAWNSRLTNLGQHPIRKSNSRCPFMFLLPLPESLSQHLLLATAPRSRPPAAMLSTDDLEDGGLVMTIPRSCRVSTESSWISVLLESVNHINLSQLCLKRLIPIEHDLSLP